MNIKVLTLVFFSSLMCIGNATEKARDAKSEQIPSSKLGERPETLEDLKVLTKDTFNALKKENDSLKYRLWDDYGHLCVTSAETPKNVSMASDSGYQVLDHETEVEFVQKVFADFRKKFVTPIVKLKQENRLLNNKLAQLRAEATLPPGSIRPVKKKEKLSPSSRGNLPLVGTAQPGGYELVRREAPLTPSIIQPYVSPTTSLGALPAFNDPFLMLESALTNLESPQLTVVSYISYSSSSQTSVNGQVVQSQQTSFQRLTVHGPAQASQ